MAKLHGSKFISVLLALLLFAALALLCPQAHAAATRLDPAHPVTLTVNVPEDMPGLKEIDYKANVWRVASVDDSVEYTLLPAFDALKFEGYTLNGTDINNYKDLKTETELLKVDELAKALYERALGHKYGEEPAEPAEGAAEPPKGVAPDAVLSMHSGTGTVSKTTSGTDLLPGYYLIVPEDCSDGEYLYRFLPTLIAVPHLGEVKPEGAPEYEDWLYDVTARFKPDKEPCIGDVKIVKILNGYNETLEGADFVFTVRATKDAKVVYSNVISLHFDKADWADRKMSKEYIIRDLPVGSLVEVEEVYSGSAYKLVEGYPTVAPEDGLVIAADPEATDPQILTFTFVNTPDDHVPHGTSALNHYEMVTGEYGHKRMDDSTQEPSQSPQPAN